MIKRGKVYLDIIMWILIIVGVIIIIGWYLLKSFGIINTPIWLESIPYLGGGISILGGAYQLGRILNGIEITNKKVNYMGKDLHDIKSEFSKLKNNQELCLSGQIKNSPYKK